MIEFICNQFINPKHQISTFINLMKGSLVNLTLIIFLQTLMFKFFLGLLVIEASLAFLQVYGPSCAVPRFPSNIQYTLSNFGEILYGQTILGQLRLPKDPQLCKTEGQLANNKKTETNTNDILLVKRGNCNFTQKVINAQNLGADLIIIYDNVEGNNLNVIMKNDGHGHLAGIPSLFISNEDGLKLMKTTNDCPNLPIVKILFEIYQKQKSQVTLWLDASNRETYILARDFYKNDYYQVIKDRVDFNVRFRIENTCDEWICSTNDCIYGPFLLSKFCRNSIKSDNPAIATVKGVELIYQQLREYFLWEQLKVDQKNKWWNYMNKFDHQICIQQADIADCSYSVMKTASVSQKIIKKIKESVQQTIKRVKQSNDQNVVKQSYTEAKQLGIFFYPEATINNRNFYGLFKAPEVFEAICSSLIDPPRQCITFVKQNHNLILQGDDSAVWKAIVIIICLMALGFIIALVVYTRMVRKEVNQQLSVEVNKMVESYVTLGNKKDSSNNYSKFES